MAVQFRSYGSKGNFRGNLKVSDRAAAKRDRDKEFIQELKDQNVALEDRDKTLIAALNKKYDTERSARKIVEETRRQGVEAERKQRVANAKLAADFAEQEAGVHSSNVQALTELLPQVAESINEIQEKRKAYDADQAFQALEKAGLTPDQYKEFKSSSLTSDQFSTSTQAWAVALREAGISWHQYNAMMQRTGGYGLGFERYDVRRIANSFSAFIAAEGNVENADGVSFNDALNSTNLPNNSSRQGIIEEFVTRFKKQSGLINYSLPFREETLKGSFESQVNTFRNKATQTMLKQSQIEGLEQAREAYLGEFDANKIQEKIDTVINPKERHGLIKEYISYTVDLVKMDKIDPDELGQLYNLRVTNANGKVGTLRELYPGLANQLDEAVYERRTVEYRRINANMNIGKQQRAIQVENVHATAFALPAEQQAAYYQSVLDDPKQPLWLKAKIKDMVDNADDIRNQKILEYYEQAKRDGRPVTRSWAEQVNPTGQVGRMIWSDITSRENSGVEAFEKVVKEDTTTIIDRVTKSLPQAIKHDQRGKAKFKALQEYRRRYNAKLPHMPKQQAYEEALAETEELLREGTEGDVEKRKGPFKFLPDPQNPLSGGFTEIATESTTSETAPRNLAEQYDDLGLDLLHTKNSIWETSTLQTMTHQARVGQHVWRRADTIALLTKGADGNIQHTAAEVLKFQMEAANVDVPVWLAKQVTAQQELNKLGVSNIIYSESTKLGADRQVLGMRALSDIEVNAPGVNTDITVTSAYDASGEPGSDFVISNGQRGAKFYFPYSSKVVAVERNSNWETNLETNPNGPRGYGNYVDLRVQLPNGRVADVRIAHLDSVANIRNGQVLTQGAFVGTQGRTGSTTAAHMSLDWYQPGTSTPDWEAAEWFLNNYLHG